MNSDQETFTKMVLEALHRTWEGLGDAAWILVAGAMLLGCFGCLLLLRLIMSRDERKDDQPPLNSDFP